MVGVGHRSMYVAQELLSLEVGEELCFPQQIVFLRELHNDEIAQGWCGKKTKCKELIVPMLMFVAVLPMDIVDMD